ncbi:hypothetical protein [Brevibacterium picturae]|uniref:Integral membrane protein n=1 Tax=Brevibacterium picturae TaxID=260553 RepID=A0ABP4NLL0_9MICO
MSDHRRPTVSAMPWLAAAGAATMSWVVIARWRDLGISDRTALGLDAVAYAASIRPLARTQARGWWILYIATVVQPAFGGVDVALDPGRWKSGLGRTAAAAAIAAGLLSVRRHYA